MQSELIRSVKAKARFNLDPRTKLLLMLIVNITIFRASSLYVMVALSAIPISLLLLSGKPKAAAVSALAYIGSAMANEYIVPITHGALKHSNCNGCGNAIPLSTGIDNGLLLGNDYNSQRIYSLYGTHACI